MRRNILIVSVLVLIVVVAAAWFLSRDLDRYRPQLQTQIEKKLGRPVTLGHLSLSFFPVAVKVDGLTIQESPEFHSTRPFVQAADVYVSVGLLSLFGSNPVVKSLRLDQPKLEFIKGANGVWNFATLGSGQSQSQGGSSQSQLTLDELKITDGQVGLTDLAQSTARSAYDHIDIDLHHFAPHKQMELELGAHLPGTGKQLVQFNGKVGPIEAQSAASTPISGHVTLDELSLSGVNRLAPGTIPQGDDAVVTGETDISTTGQILEGKGDLKLANLIVNGSKLDFPVSARYNLRADRAADQVEIRSSSIGLGQTSFNVDGKVDAHAKPASGNVHLVTKNSSISEIGRLAGAFGVAAQSSYKINGTLSADVTAIGPLTTPQLNGTVQMQNLDISGGEIKQPVSIAALDLALSPMVVHSNEFTARSGSTSLMTQFDLTNYQKADRSINLSTKTTNANVSELVNMAKAYGFQGSRGIEGSGTLTANVRVQGPLADTSALNFSGNADVKGVTLQEPGLAKPVSLRTVSVQFSQNTVSMTNLNASVGSTTLSGNLSAKNFAAPQLQFALAADKIDTAELQELTQSKSATASAGKPAANPAPAKSASPSLFDKITGSGTLSANTIKAQDIILTSVHATCRLDHGVVQLAPLTSTLFGGKEAGTITFDTRPVEPAVAMNVKFSGVDSNALLSAFSSLKDTLTGTLAADTNLHFTLSKSSPELARSLNGTLGFNLANGHLKNVNILGEIAKIEKFIRAAPGSQTNGTDLKRLAGTMDIRNGVASTSNLTAEMSVGSLAANGSVSLVDQGLNMHVNAVLPKDTSQSVGGSGIGGYLNTALSNNKGELVLPVIVTGTTSHPAFTPDVQALAQMKLKNLLPTSGDPSKLTSGLIGAVTGKQGASGILNQVLGGNANANQQPAKPNQQAPDAVNAILQQFGKKKPKQQ